jgi:hypothetical protein
MSDTRYLVEGGVRYEAQRALLSRDYWMSVGFLEEDFENRFTWEAALLRGPVDEKKRSDNGTQTEQLFFAGEPINSLPDLEETPSLTALFCDEEKDDDFSMEIDTSLFTFEDEFSDIGTPTMHDVTYNQTDLNGHFEPDRFFGPTHEQGVTVPPTPDPVFLDMNKAGISGMNLGEWISGPPIGRFIFRPFYENLLCSETDL